jgi:hypothetical protein
MWCMEVETLDKRHILHSLTVHRRDVLELGYQIPVTPAEPRKNRAHRDKRFLNTSLCQKSKTKEIKRRAFTSPGTNKETMTMRFLPRDSGLSLPTCTPLTFLSFDA